jgi:glycosyltransferase involved in cell wall biosynthesis
MKFIVAQIGARRSYAIPAALDDAGMLERFYTDMTGDVGLGKVLAAAASLALPSKRARRLTERRLPSSICAKTVTFPGLALIHALRCVMLKHKPAAMFRETLRFSNSLGRAMAECGFDNASHLYSMLGECGPLLVAAKKRGLKVVSEIYILLSTERILAEEQKKFPSWEPDAPDYGVIRREISDEDVLLTYSDFAICPSEAVRNDLVENFGFVRERTAIVPYGMNPDLLSIRNEPIRGRLLFAGTADLRKGIHYLAMAAEKLLARGLRYEFRIAGDVRPDIARQHVCRHLNFLGRIPRGEMSNEFALADVFVLPSLAEGSAEAIYEALASGVPVVTTLEAGSVVRNRIEGRIVAPRDPETLANAIAEIVEDREKREQMALAARERAREFTWEVYGERLVAALKSFVETRGVLECA